MEQLLCVLYRTCLMTLCKIKSSVNQMLFEWALLLFCFQIVTRKTNKQKQNQTEVGIKGSLIFF